MSDDNRRQVAATPPDLQRHVATSDDSEYSLSIEEALTRYEAAGLPRTTRSIQRYCAKGDLDANRVERPFGWKFLITSASVDRHIAYINEVRLVATGRDLPRHAATDVVPQNQGEPAREEAGSGDDNPRPATTTPDLSSPVAAKVEPVSQPVAADVRIIEMLERENGFLRDQVAVKDGQIKDLSERVRETNLLTGGLQKLLTPLLGRGGIAPPEERVHTYTPEGREGDNNPAA